MKRLGIYGGSFSPPHEGHFKSALSFYDACRLDELLIIPAGMPPHKELDGGASSPDRLEMTKIVFSPERCGGRAITVSDYEVLKKGTSFTYQTVGHFADRNVKIYLLMGSDMFLSFHTWKNPGAIARQATLVLQKRAREETASTFREQAAYLRKTFGARILTPRFEPIEVSSAFLREKLAKGESTEGLLYEGCADYIRRNGLYGTDGIALEKIRKRLPEFVSEKRIGHVLGVEKEVCRMAKLYGLSGEESLELRKAALLHDLTHERSPEEQKALDLLYGIGLTSEDFLSPAVIHQFTGAYAARDLFSLGERGADAIACHTTGKPDMTTGEKILCIADYIEETRPYESCRRLREDFYAHFTEENKERLLDECMLRYLEETVAHLKEKNAHIHSLTLRSYDFYKKELVNCRIL